jgi:tetratricopeptide (TPR) repeat protein
VGLTLLWLRRYDEVIQETRPVVEANPNFAEARYYLGLAYEQKAMFTDAIAQFRQALNASGGTPRYVSALGHSYAISGQRSMVEQSLARLKEQQKQRYVGLYDFAVLYAGLNQTEQTFKYLDMAYEERSFWLLWLNIDPRFDTIRSDPRYQDLLRRMHLNP